MFAVLEERLFRILYDAHLAQKNILIQNLEKARRAARGQGVVGPGEIVAERFARPAAHEHRARVADFGEKFLAVSGRETLR